MSFASHRREEKDFIAALVWRLMMTLKEGFWSSLFGTDDSNSAGSANLATERLKVIVASEIGETIASLLIVSKK